VEKCPFVSADVGACQQAHNLHPQEESLKYLSSQPVYRQDTETVRDNWLHLSFIKKNILFTGFLFQENCIKLQVALLVLSAPGKIVEVTSFVSPSKFKSHGYNRRLTDFR
jgi:hypothetical protein